MKISELIKELESAKEKHGDIQIYLIEYGFGGEAYYLCKGIKKTTEGFHVHDFYPEEMLDGNMNESEIKNLIPSYNGNKESLCETGDKNIVNGIIIDRGSLIYST